MQSNLKAFALAGKPLVQRNSIILAVFLVVAGLLVSTAAFGQQLHWHDQWHGIRSSGGHRPQREGRSYQSS